MARDEREVSSCPHTSKWLRSCGAGAIRSFSKTFVVRYVRFDALYNKQARPVEMYQNISRFRKLPDGDWPNARAFTKRVVALPVHSDVSEQMCSDGVSDR